MRALVGRKVCVHGLRLVVVHGCGGLFHAGDDGTDEGRAETAGEEPEHAHAEAGTVGGRLNAGFTEFARPEVAMPDFCLRQPVVEVPEVRIILGIGEELIEANAINLVAIVALVTGNVLPGGRRQIVGHGTCRVRRHPEPGYGARAARWRIQSPGRRCSRAPSRMVWR